MARFDLTSKVNGEYGEGRAYSPIEEAKDVVVDLPLGLAGDPLAAPQCPEIDLLGQPGKTACPLASRVGMIDLEHAGHPTSSLRPESAISAIYNMVPENGYPAVFGFNYEGFSVVMYASVVYTPAGYDLQVTVPGVPRAQGTRRRLVDVLRRPSGTRRWLKPTRRVLREPRGLLGGAVEGEDRSELVARTE